MMVRYVCRDVCRDGPLRHNGDRDMANDDLRLGCSLIIRSRTFASNSHPEYLRFIFFHSHPEILSYQTSLALTSDQ